MLVKFKCAKFGLGMSKRPNFKLTPPKSTCTYINDGPLVNQTYDNGIQFD